jgi:hypothetical protein
MPSRVQDNAMRQFVNSTSARTGKIPALAV